MIRNSLYWSHYINDVFIPQIDVFKNCLINKVLVSFDELAEESDKLAEEEYDRLGSLFIGGDDFLDMADVAKKAQDKAIDYYITMSKMKDGIIGLFTSGLYHLFEQQTFIFYRKEILSIDKENNISILHWAELKKRFKDKELNLESLKSFEKINILRLTCNVIKHVEGKSAEDLRQCKPEYFKADGNILGLGKPFFVDIRPVQPLTGEDVKIPIGDFLQYCEDVKDFWKELNDRIRSMQDKGDA